MFLRCRSSASSVWVSSRSLSLSSLPPEVHLCSPGLSLASLDDFSLKSYASLISGGHSSSSRTTIFLAHLLVCLLQEGQSCVCVGQLSSVFHNQGFFFSSSFRLLLVSHLSFMITSTMFYCVTFSLPLVFCFYNA